MATTLLSGAWVLSAALSVTYWSHYSIPGTSLGVTLITWGKLEPARLSLPVRAHSLHGIHNSFTEQAQPSLVYHLRVGKPRALRAVVGCSG